MVGSLFAGFLRFSPPLGFPPLHHGLYTLNGIKFGPPDDADRCTNTTACGADFRGMNSPNPNARAGPEHRDKNIAGENFAN